MTQENTEDVMEVLSARVEHAVKAFYLNEAARLDRSVSWVVRRDLVQMMESAVKEDR